MRIDEHDDDLFVLRQAQQIVRRVPNRSTFLRNRWLGDQQRYPDKHPRQDMTCFRRMGR
ncbi:hypothetical protein GCM10022212_18290 [Actimicrobium antarcticum]|uniref:Uncharacterized protein n=1 Tax=Actimicrobium antarcticum TaxID=1051899 RepID=A0ABP7T664_9BURK